MKATTDRIRQHREPSRKVPKGALATALLSATAVIVTACGATVDTELNLNSDNGGQRSLTAFLEAQILEDNDLTVDELEDSIENHLPQELDFDGIHDEGDQFEADFILEFASTEDYAEQVTSLLVAGDIDIDPEIQHEIVDTELRTGVEINENFDSLDLLEWLVNGLVADGIVEEADRMDVLSQGASNVVIDETTYNTFGGQLRLNEVEDYGFDLVGIVVSDAPDGAFDTTVVLANYRDPEPDGQVRIDDYLEATLPDGAQISDGVADSTFSHGHTVTFQDSDLDSLNASLQGLLNSPDTQLAVGNEPLAEGAIGLSTVWSGFVDCSSVCHSTGGIQFAVEVPLEDEDAIPGANAPSWVRELGIGDALSMHGPEVELSVDQVMTMTDVRAHTEINSGGGASQTIEFSVASDDVTSIGDAFESALHPADDVGTLDVRESDGITTYTVTIEGSQDQEFSEQLGQYIPGASYTRSELDGSTYNVSIDLPLRQFLADSTPEDVMIEATLPSGHSFNEDLVNLSGYTVDGSNISAGQGDSSGERLAFAASGSSIGNVLLIVGVVLLGIVVVIAAVILVRRRKPANQPQVATVHHAATGPAASGTPPHPGYRADSTGGGSQLAVEDTPPGNESDGRGGRDEHDLN